MWIKLAEIIQEPSVRRLGLALIVSIILHSLLFGGFNFSLPSVKKEMHVIDARIQMPKVVIKPLVKPVAPKPSVVPKPEQPIAAIEPPQPEAKPKAPVEPQPMPEPPLAELTTETPTKTISPESSDTLQKSIDIGDSLPTPGGEPQPPQSTDAGLVINENAYQYVETEFDVRTEIDGSAQGKASITFNMVTNEQYQLKWLTQPRGVAALFIGDLLQTSTGELTKSGLQPSTYQYEFANKPDKARSVSFDWQAKKVISQTAKGTKTEDLPDGAQDLVSFMYQFMYVAPLQNMQIAITNGKKMRFYDYSFVGEENINSTIGELKTIHIVHTGSGEEDKTELWLALDYQYLPVKIRKTEVEGRVYELLAMRINTNRPVVDNKIIK
jgi:Protein of unknown function (DUF3108)